MKKDSKQEIDGTTRIESRQRVVGITHGLAALGASLGIALRRTTARFVIQMGQWHILKHCFPLDLKECTKGASTYLCISTLPSAPSH